MRVVLLRPPAQNAPLIRARPAPRRYPLRLASLAAVLREAGATVGFVDCPFWGYDERAGAGAVFEFHPDIVYAEIDPRYAAEQVKFLVRLKDLGGIRVVVGGPWATRDWEEVLKASPTIDAIVLGEVEETFVDLLATWQEGRSPARLPGVAQVVGKRPVAGPKRAPIADLDALPYPDRVTVPLRSYNAGRLQTRFFAPVAASRGCPRRCIFCSALSGGSPVRLRSPGHVTGEIEELVRQYGVGEIGFVDPALNANEQWASVLADTLASCGVSWRCTVAAENFTRQLAQTFRRGGCKAVAFGPISPTEEGVEQLGVLEGPEEVKQAIEHALAEELRIELQVVFGDPPLPSLEQAQAFAAGLKRCRVSLKYVGREKVAGGNAPQGTPSYQSKGRLFGTLRVLPEHLRTLVRARKAHPCGEESWELLP